MTWHRHRLAGSLLGTALLFAGGCDGPLEPAPPGAMVAVEAGVTHTCAISDDGRGYCWGDDTYGQLGADLRAGCRGDVCDRPLPIAGGLEFTQLAIGALHTCAVASRQIYCWGMGRFGQLGDDRQIPERCQETRAFPCSLVPRRAALGVPAAGVTAAADHTCGLGTSGEAFCWGRNQGFQLGTGDADDRTLPVRVPTQHRFQALTTGLAHTCGVEVSGQAYCWGYGSSGRLGTGDVQNRPAPTPVLNPGAPWVAVDAGYGHTCAVDEAGSVSCWGLGNEGQLGRGTRVSQATPSPIALPEPAIDVSAGGYHSCAVLEGGALYCWGSNADWQLGVPGIRRQLRPAPVPLDVGIVQVSAGFMHTCAVTVDGELYCWGANRFGQVGDGTREDRMSPVRIEF